MMNRLHGTSFRWTKFEISAAGNSSGADGPGVLVVVCNEETRECVCYDHEDGACGPCPDVNL